MNNLKLKPVIVQENVSLAKLNTFKIGGKARFFCEVSTIDELMEVVRFAKEKNLKITVLGEGSNVLISDKGVDGMVIKIAIKGSEWVDYGDYVEAKVCAGENWDVFVKNSVERGLYGAENLSAIPGSVGAAPVQNIGAYGVEVEKIISYVEAFDINSCEIKKINKDECNFNYRDSFFKCKIGKNFIIIRVCFSLEKNGSVNIAYKDIENYFSEKNISEPSLSDVRNAVMIIRGKKLPDLSIYGTAGSFFKNPVIAREKYITLKKQYPDIPSYDINEGLVKLPIAWVFDKLCGFKGLRMGNVGVYENQPLVLVNFGGATSVELMNLARFMSEKAFEKIGVSLDVEVRMIEEEN